MDNRSIHDERILEAIEACRPGSDDVADPALAYLAARLAVDPELEDLYDRLQRVDGLLAGCFRDVPVPEGLQQRVLDRLASPQSAESVPGRRQSAVSEPRGGERRSVTADARRSRVSRRWLLVAGGALTAAAVLLIAALTNIGQPEEYTEETALREAIEFFNSEDFQPGQLWSDASRSADYPLGRCVRPTPETRWRRISGFLGQEGVAYDMPRPGGVQATLYVVKRTIKGLPDEPAEIPGLQTGGCSVSAWQDGELLYVLVVKGGSETYLHYLDLPQGPVA